MDMRTNKLAKILVNYSTAVKDGEKVLIEYDDLASPLAREVYKETLRAGGLPYTVSRPSWKNEDFYRYANNKQIEYIHDIEKALVADFNVNIVLLGSENTKSLTSADSSKMVMRALARKHLSKLHQQRSATGELRWVLCNYPTQALAQDAEMSLDEYADFLYQACLMDFNDPVGSWNEFKKRQDEIIAVLNNKDEFMIKGPNADLTLRCGGRIWKNSCGHYNMPDGEVYTTPLENSIDGYIKFSYPAIYRGKEVSGVELWFENGRVVKAMAEKNEEYLLAVLDTDYGARSVGEFAFGTNNNIGCFTKDILFDEKMCSTIHIAMGASYPETGGINDSVIHWDMICDMEEGAVIADGQLIYQNGVFVI